MMETLESSRPLPVKVSVWNRKNKYICLQKYCISIDNWTRCSALREGEIKNLIKSYEICQIEIDNDIDGMARATSTCRQRQLQRRSRRRFAVWESYKKSLHTFRAGGFAQLMRLLLFVACQWLLIVWCHVCQGWIVGGEAEAACVV